QASASLEATALLDDPQLGKTARTEVAAASRDSSSLSERRQAVSDDVVDSQVRAEERADRDKERKELAEQEDAKAQAEEDAEATAEAGVAAPTEDGAEESASGWARPLEGASLTSGYGFRWGRLHAGQDYSASIGTPLRAMGAGTVVGAGPMSGYGIYIDIQYADGSVSRYGHLSSVAAVAGQQVAAGEAVAYSGNTGRSTGPHLHMEIRPGGGETINPTGWLAERGIL
ncbi:MAG: M23 family metallopeptidase, partial [Nocardioidaceae bacterium]|nr:M23 family metallopeptidase [Nocardioidaceae bacterium]